MIIGPEYSAAAESFCPQQRVWVIRAAVNLFGTEEPNERLEPMLKSQGINYGKIIDRTGPICLRRTSIEDGSGIFEIDDELGEPAFVLAVHATDAATVIDNDARGKALAPSTVQLRRSQIHTALDIAVGQGIAPESLTSLAELVNPGVVKTIFRALRTRHDGEANAYASSLATALVTIAKEWVKAPADQVTELKRLRSKLPKLVPGLTPKNKQMLLRLDGPALGRLLELPQKLWRFALSPNCPKKRALPLAQTALMIEFLLHVPLRMANVAELTFDQHISWPSGRKGKAWLLIPGVKTKTGDPYEAELSGDLLAMLRTYRDKILPKLSGRRRDEIFIAVNGHRKRATTISDLFKETTLAYLGFKVTPHQMRHIAAKLILDQNPGAFELVKQLLGHKSLKTTIAFYAGLDTSRAVRHHHALIQAVRAERLADGGGRRRPLRKPGGSQ